MSAIDHPTTASPAVVVGASRGLGRAIATALASTGTPVVALVRDAAGLGELDTRISVEVADAAVPGTAPSVLRQYRPSLVVVVAGATPVMGPLPEQTWESFSVNWHADVQIAFRWLHAALTEPLQPGGRFIMIGSGAELAGSPLSGGYAGAKATQRIITGYAQAEAERSALDLSFTTVIPARPVPTTEIGHAAVQAYSAHLGIAAAEYIERLGATPTPAIAGAAVVELARTKSASLGPAYLLTGDGLQELG
jgi:NAD(P)-dependent dehydrogenase (short-subunit alcohol dehydrogenase family)